LPRIIVIPAKKFPPKFGQTQRIRLATEGTFYRRQLSFGIVDLALHTQIHATNADDTVPLSNKWKATFFCPSRPTPLLSPISAI